MHGLKGYRFHRTLEKLIGDERFERIKQRRDEQATALGLDPTLLASKAELMSLAQNGESATAELMHWQRDLLGLKG